MTNLNSTTALTAISSEYFIEGVLVAIPEEIKKAYKADQSAERAFEKKRGAFIDLTWSFGFRSEHMQSPSTGGKISPEAFEELNNMIVDEFPAHERKLLASPTASLDEETKKEKRKIQAKIGSKRSDLKGALERRENNVAEGKGADDKRTRTPEEIINDSVADCIKRARALTPENSNLDIVALIDALNDVRKILVTTNLQSND